jgi:hypothetical protein
VFETPYKNPDSGDFGWVVPDAKRHWEGCIPSSAREDTTVGVASLLYLFWLREERFAGTRGQSAASDYRRGCKGGQSQRPQNLAKAVQTTGDMRIQKIGDTIASAPVFGGIKRGIDIFPLKINGVHLAR